MVNVQPIVISPEILMDESEFSLSDKTDDELRKLLAIHPKQKDFHLYPRLDDE
jgi:hypothetical protein